MQAAARERQSSSAPIPLPRRSGGGEYEPRAQLRCLIEEAEQRSLPAQVPGHRIDVVDAQHGAALETGQRLGGQGQRSIQGKVGRRLPGRGAHGLQQVSLPEPCGPHSHSGAAVCICSAETTSALKPGQ